MPDHRLLTVVLALAIAGCATSQRPPDAPLASGDFEPAYRGNLTSELWIQWAAGAPSGNEPTSPTVAGGNATRPGYTTYPVLHVNDEDGFIVRVETRIATPHAGFRTWVELPSGFEALGDTRYHGAIPIEGIEHRVRAVAIAEGRWNVQAFAQSDEESTAFLIGEFTIDVVE